MERRSALAAPRTSILHRERRALNFFRYGKYTAGRLDATSFCFSFADSAAVCTYLTRSLSPKKYDWSRATPGETERLDTHTGSRRFAHPLCACDYTRASEYVHTRTDMHLGGGKKRKTERTQLLLGWTVEHCAARMNDGLSAVLTLFFYRRGRDVHSFHYFRISALKAALRVSNPLISVPLSLSLSPSLCMPHFLLGWNASNRSFFSLRVSPPALIRQLVGIVRLYSEPTTIRFESIVRSRSWRYRRNENVAWKRSAGIGKIDKH